MFSIFLVILVAVFYIAKKLLPKEGFQVASGTDATCQTLPIPSAYDKYYKEAYDTYIEKEENAAIAAATADTAANPISSVPDWFIPNFGGLTEWDPNNIPWDADNRYANPNQIVWGVCPNAATLSIFQKAYMNNVQPDIDPNNGRPLYSFPDFGNYHTNDNSVGITLAVVDGLYNLVGPLVVMGLGIGGYTAGAAAVDRIRNSAQQPATARAPAGTTSKPASSLGSMIRTGSMKSVTRQDTSSAAGTAKKGGGAKAILKTMSRLISRTLPAKVAATIAGSTAAAAFFTVTAQYYISAFFIVIEVLCIGISILMPVILDSLTNDIRLCPQGTTRMNQIIPDWANTIISWIPVIGDIVSTLQPYLCMYPDGSSVIGQPVPDPVYYYDMSLSAFYHSNCPMRDIGKYEYEIPFCSRPPPGIPPFPGSRYDPPLNKEDIFLPWAEFADPVMLDRMAQFYQDYSIRSPLVNYDNTISYDIITKFLGVAASSAYSCDVICELTTITYDPYTGCKYKEEKLVDSFGDNLHDRRFYFYKDPAKVDQVVPGTSWKEGKGLLTVVGCTNSDGTAPDAWNGISLPKIFNVGLKPLTKSMREVLGSSAFWKNLGASVGQNTSMVVGMGTMSVQQLTNADMTFHDPQTNRENEVYVGNERVLIYDYYNINIGPDIGKSTGYVPTGQIACRKTTITPAQCALPSYLQSVVNQYHATNPKKHLKTITSIQTWGKAIPENQTNEYHYPSNSSKQTLDVSGPYQTYGDACYYGGYEADYDPMTNLETNIRPAQILVKNYHDTSVNKNSCVFLIDTKNTFLDINTAGYKPIDLRDPVLKRTMAARKYPFSKVVEIPPPIPPGNQITKALLDRLVSTFNATHVSKGRQIIRVLRTWQPTIDKARVDMEVEMMRSTAVETKQLGTKPYTIPKQPTVLKETVRFTLTPTLDDYLSDGSDVLNSGAFIQRNTPPSLNDISGGILSLRSSMDSFGSSVQKLVAPLLNIGASQKVLTASQNAKTATDSALERLYVSQTLKDPCSALKCSDPDLLNAIVARYNEDNLPPPGVQFGVKTQQMVQVLKVGVASPNQCDILFNNRIEEYDSLMNNPIRVSNVAKAMRFTLDIPAGQTCTYSINRTYVDVSSTAIGLRSDLEQSQLVSFYSAPQCSIDYRSAEIRGALKLKLSAFDSASAISSWKTILASYSPTPTQCEYKVLKDYTVYSPPPTKTTTNVESYLLATFTIDQQCRATLQSVKEIIPTQLDIRLDTRTGVRTPYLNGQPVILPALFSYDTSVPSQRVNSASSPF